MCHYLYLVLPHSLIFIFSYFTFDVFFVVLYVCVDFNFSFVFNFIGINRIYSYNIFCLWFSFLQSSQIPWLWLSLLIQSWVDIAERYNNLKRDGGSRSFSAQIPWQCHVLPFLGVRDRERASWEIIVEQGAGITMKQCLFKAVLNCSHVQWFTILNLYRD